MDLPQNHSSTYIMTMFKLYHKTLEKHVFSRVFAIFSIAQYSYFSAKITVTINQAFLFNFCYFCSFVQDYSFSRAGYSRNILDILFTLFVILKTFNGCKILLLDP